MRRKKNKDRLLKAGLIGALITGAVYYNTKKLIFGQSKLRKALFITSASALILYNCHGDKLEKLGNSIYKGADKIFNNPVRNENKDLTEKLFQAGKIIDSLKSLPELPKIKEEKDTINKLSKIDTSENKYNVESTILNYEKNEILETAYKEKTTYWYVVKKGETLSSISKLLTGKIETYKMLANFNDIKNPSNLPVGFPLKIPEITTINYQYLNKNNYPKKIGIMKRGETIEDFVINTFEKLEDVKKISEEIINYNKKLGNIIPEEGYSYLKEAIIYLR